MGQRKWVWGCALLLALSIAGRIVAQQADANPFEDVEGAPENAAAAPKAVRTGFSASSSTPGEAEQRIELLTKATDDGKVETTPFQPGKS